MSFSDAVGQVDQIMQWEQQIGNGSAFNGTATGGTSAGGSATATATNAAGGSSAATATNAAGGTSAATASTSATSSPSSTAATFAAALAQAQSSEGSSLLSSGDGTTTALDPTSSAGSDLLGSGDSQLLAALSSLASASPSAAAATAATTAMGATATGVSAATGATAMGAPATGALATGAPATSSSDPRIQAMLQEANSLLGQPYVWGGGHGGWGQTSGYDCSGFVSAVLHAGGYLQSPQDTTSLPSAAGIESGPGQYVTIYDRDEPGQEGHVIIDLNGQFYESGGEHGGWGGGGGVEAIATPPASYLSTFNLVLHPEGL